ncbi:MAG: hypothetical protein L0Y58_01525 [Verrucomicrobia subdivision 3 bacterium]|nr:hypothetical protein [Limisphaerales bacterium]
MGGEGRPAICPHLVSNGGKVTSCSPLAEANPGTAARRAGRPSAGYGGPMEWTRLSHDNGRGHLHLARNFSATENVEVCVSYFDVPPGGPVRLDAANPGNYGF